MHPRTLLIGLDGATFSILDSLIEQGIMPNLERLLAAGTRAELASVVPPLTPPAWTSLMTGRSPGSHGIFDFLRFELTTEDRHLRVMDARDVACETIWSMVTHHGLRATVLNFPLTYPPPSIAGYVVPGWVPWRHLRLACHPADLYDRLKALPGFDPRELAMDMSLEEKALEGCHREEDYEELIRLHIRRERQWFKIAATLMREDPCHLTAVLFDGVDKLQHICWRFIDPDLFSSTPSDLELRIRELCLEYFREVDGFVGEIVAMGGPGANTIIVSDHGFGPTVEVFYLNAWLHQHGYLAWADGAEIEQKHAETLGLGTMARRFYEVDWSRTTAYCPTPSSNGIYLFPPTSEGETAPSRKAYEDLRLKLTQSLSSFTDPATQQPVVTRIWTREEAFAGKHGALAPDLTVSLRDGGFVSILPSDEVLKARPEPTGTHRPHGVFVAAGAGMRRGVSVEPLSILDVAPAILYSLGLPVPEDLEGRVPTEIFEPSQLQSRPVAFEKSTRSAEPARGQTTPPVDADMEEEVLKQLRALGYME